MGAEDEYSNPLAPTPAAGGVGDAGGRIAGGAGAPGEQPSSTRRGGSSGQPSPAVGTTLDPAGVIRLIRTLMDEENRFGLGTDSPVPSRPRCARPRTANVT